MVLKLKQAEHGLDTGALGRPHRDTCFLERRVCVLDAVNRGLKGSSAEEHRQRLVVA